MNKFLLTLVLVPIALYGTFIKKVIKTSIVGAHGLTFTPNGQVLLADTFRSKETHTSRVFRLEGILLKDTGFQGLQIAGISQIPTGYLVCDLAASIVYELNFSFETVRKWKNVQSWNTKKSKNGRVYAITAQGQFLELLETDSPRILIDGLQAPFDFDFAEDGKVWISEQGPIGGAVSRWKIDAFGKYKKDLNPTFNWNNPEGIFFRNGTLWALNTGAGSLVSISDDGLVQEEIRELGIPILVRENNDKELVIYSNQFNGGSALLTISTKF